MRVGKGVIFGMIDELGSKSLTEGSLLENKKKYVRQAELVREMEH